MDEFEGCKKTGRFLMSNSLYIPILRKRFSTSQRDKREMSRARKLTSQVLVAEATGRIGGLNNTKTEEGGNAFIHTVSLVRKEERERDVGFKTLGVV